MNNRHLIHKLLLASLILLLSACGRTSPSPILPTTTTTLPGEASLSQPSATETSTPTPRPAFILPSPTPTPNPRVITPENASLLHERVRPSFGGLTGAPAYSPDGTLFAAPASANTMVYQTSPEGVPGKTIFVLPTGKFTNFVAFSPDSTLLAACSMDPDVSLWNMATGALVQEIDAQSEQACSDLQFSPYGHWLAAGFYDDQVRVYEVATGIKLAEVKGRLIAFSLDGRLAAVVLPEGARSGQTWLYQTSDWSVLHELEGGKAFFLPDGRLIVQIEAATRVYDLTAGGVPIAFDGVHPVTNEGGTLLAVFERTQVKIYNLSDGSLRQTMQGEFASADNLTFSPDGSLLAAAVLTAQCPYCTYTLAPPVVWQVADGTQISTYLSMSATPNLTFSLSGKFLSIAEPDLIQFLKLPKPQVVATLTTFSPGVEGLTFSPDSYTLVTVGGSQYAADVWATASGERAERYLGKGSAGDQVTFSPDGKILAVRGDLWSVSEGRRLSEIEKVIEAGETERASSVAFSPNGQYIAEGFVDGGVQILDRFAGEVISFTTQYTGEVADLGFSRQGDSLALIHTGANPLLEIRPFPQGEAEIARGTFIHAEWSPVGDFLAVLKAETGGNLYGRVEFRLAATALPNGGLEADNITSLAFSPDGRTLATGSTDGKLQLWNAADGSLLASYEVSAEVVTGVAFSRDGFMLAWGAIDGSAGIWGLPE